MFVQLMYAWWNEMIRYTATSSIRCGAVALAVAACAAQSPAVAAAGDADALYANGFDGPSLANAYFVSPQGLNSNPGSANLPFQTIAKGISVAAGDLSKRNVLVAQGTYNESVALVDGVSVYGQYQAGGWARDPAYYTIIDGVSVVGNHERAVIASNITSPTTFDGFVIFGPANDNPGGNSYAVYVSGASANLHISNNVIFGGQGGPGDDGATGPDGSAGIAGSGRNQNLAVTDAAYDAKVATGNGACSTANNRAYTNGGTLMCGGTAVNGGNGGGNRCPVMSFCDNGDPNYGCQQNAANFHWTKYTALDGAAGTTGGGATDGAFGAGAIAGDDMIQIFANLYAGYVCYIPPDKTYGLDGGNGANGGHGAAVAGCSIAAGTVVGGDWLGGAAASGIDGGNGGGGGGGGAGGGGKCEADSPHTACTGGGGKDTLGGHGGGAGSGACGGAGSGAGNAGGGVFGIFIVGNSSAPIVSGNTLFGGSGGRGGAGGIAGSGGMGGLGAPGGTTGVPTIFCTDLAGRGGNGGNGGDGSGAGGGCGGVSFGIYTFGIGTPDYCVGTNNAFIDGAPGDGGTGGLSLINSGGNGAAGVLGACSFN